MHVSDDGGLRAASIFKAALISLSRLCARSKTVSASARWLSSVIEILLSQ